MNARQMAGAFLVTNCGEVAALVVAVDDICTTGYTFRVRPRPVVGRGPPGECLTAALGVLEEIS